MATTESDLLAGLWSSRGMEVTLRGPDGAHQVTHHRKPFAWIGTHPRADVVLADEKQLPCSLYLHSTSEGIYCLGLARSSTKGWLKPATYAPLGPYRIRARFDDDGPAPNVPSWDPQIANSLAGSRPRLEIRSRHGTSATRWLSRQLTIVGRESPSSLLLKSTSISRTHCVLYWDGRSLWVVDLLSRNGVLVDGQRTDFSEVRPGQELLLGQNQVRYLGPDEAANEDSDESDLSEGVAPLRSRNRQVWRDEVEPRPSDQVEPQPRQETPRQPRQEQARLPRIEAPADEHSASDHFTTTVPAERAARNQPEQAAGRRERELVEQATALQATIDGLHRQRASEQAEWAADRAQLEELTSRLTEVERERESQRETLVEQERLAGAQQEQLGKQALEQEQQLETRLAEIETRTAEQVAAERAARIELEQAAGRRECEWVEQAAALQASIDGLHQQRASEQAEWAAERGRLEELAARLKEVEQERDGLRESLAEQERLAGAQQEQLGKQALEREQQLETRLAEIKTRTAEKVAAERAVRKRLKQAAGRRERELVEQAAALQATIDGLDQQRAVEQAEWTADRGRLEELTSRLTEVERERESQRETLVEQERLSAVQQEQLRREALERERQLETRLAEIETCSAEQVAAERAARVELAQAAERREGQWVEQATALQATIDGLQQQRASEQAGSAADRDRLEELTARLHDVEQARASQRKALVEHERLAAAQQAQLGKQALEREQQLETRLAEIETRAAEQLAAERSARIELEQAAGCRESKLLEQAAALQASIDGLQQQRTSEQAEWTADRGRLEELTAQLEDLERERAALRATMDEQECLARAQQEQRHREALEREQQLETRLAEIGTRAAEQLAAERAARIQFEVAAGRRESELVEHAAALRTTIAGLQQRGGLAEAGSIGGRGQREELAVRVGDVANEREQLRRQDAHRADMDESKTEAATDGWRPRISASDAPLPLRSPAGLDGLDEIFQRLSGVPGKEQAALRRRRLLWGAVGCGVLLVAAAVVKFVVDLR